MQKTGLGRREVLAASLALLAGCAPKAGKAPVRIGYQRSGVLLLAKARAGLDKALEGLSSGVQWVEFPAGPPMMEAMAAGAVDFGAVGDAPPIFAQASKAPIVYAAVQPVTGAGSALLVPATSKVSGVAELRGRKIAFTKASSAHLFIIQALKTAGLGLSDIQPVYLSPGDAAGAFGNGAIDAWATWDPYYALAQRDQKARVLLTGETLPKSSAFYIANKHFAEGSPKVLSALLTALKDVAAWGETHRAELSQLVSNATGLPQDIVAASLRRGPYAVRPVDEAALAAEQASADIFLEIGAIPARIDVRSAAWRGWAG